jgi:hypothetical protein
MSQSLSNKKSLDESAHLHYYSVFSGVLAYHACGGLFWSASVYDAATRPNLLFRSVSCGLLKPIAQSPQASTFQEGRPSFDTAQLEERSHLIFSFLLLKKRRSVSLMMTKINTPVVLKGFESPFKKNTSWQNFHEDNLF